MLEEKFNLDKQIERVIDFMHGDDYPKLKPTEQGLYMVYLSEMQGHQKALSRIIEYKGEM